MPVYACSCATGDPASSFNNAKTVFIGRVLSGSEKLTINEPNSKPQIIYAGTLRFSMQEVFKGTATEEITIEVASHKDTSCGPYGLTRGERYVVYAYADKEGKNLYTGVCTRTKEADSKYAKEDLDFLRNLPPPGVGGTLRGRVWADLRAGGATPLENVSVKIRDEGGQVINVFTDKEGHFEIKQLKPGKYTVEPDFPANYISDRKSSEVKIEDRGAASVGFEAYIDGTISGRVLDQDGNLFNHIFLKMVDDGKTVYGHSKGEDGAFEMEGAPPGEYRVFLELQNKDSRNNKLYYYPGTFEVEKATVLRLGLGEKIEGLEFHLPKGFSLLTVEGQVFWKDGTPAAKVEVHLLCPQSTEPNGFAIEFGPGHVYTDEQGRFRIDGFSGETYWLEARGTQLGSKGDPIRVYSPPRKLSLEKSLKDLKVLLSREGFGEGCPN